MQASAAGKALSAGAICLIGLAEILARPERFELPTPRFVVWCSIQLSYGRVGALRVLGKKSQAAEGQDRPDSYRLRKALASAPQRPRRLPGRRPMRRRSGLHRLPAPGLLTDVAIG